MRVAVFDVDGVLVDCDSRIREATLRSERLPESEARRVFWETFLNPELLRLDRPRLLGIELFRDRVKRYRVLIITGRPERLRRCTIRQLREFGIDPSRILGLLMRSNDDKRPSSVVKRELLERFLDEHPEATVMEVHDDDPESLIEMGKVARQAALYLHTKDGYEVLRKGAADRHNI